MSESPLPAGYAEQFRQKRRLAAEEWFVAILLSPVVFAGVATMFAPSSSLGRILPSIWHWSSTGAVPWVILSILAFIYVDWRVSALIGAVRENARATVMVLQVLAEAADRDD